MWEFKFRKDSEHYGDVFVDGEYLDRHSAFFKEPWQELVVRLNERDNKLLNTIKEVTDEMKAAMEYNEKEDVVTLKNPVGNVEKWNNTLLKLLEGEK